MRETMEIVPQAEAAASIEAVSRAEIDVQIRTARAYPRREDARVARRARTLNKTPWLNRRAVREELLRLAKELRPFHSYTRVSEETLVQLSWHFRQAMIWHVKSMPSKGRTI